MAGAIVGPQICAGGGGGGGIPPTVPGNQEVEGSGSAAKMVISGRLRSRSLSLSLSLGVSETVVDLEVLFMTALMEERGPWLWRCSGFRLSGRAPELFGCRRTTCSRLSLLRFSSSSSDRASAMFCVLVFYKYQDFFCFHSSDMSGWFSTGLAATFSSPLPAAFCHGPRSLNVHTTRRQRRGTSST